MLLAVLVATGLALLIIRSVQVGKADWIAAVLPGFTRQHAESEAEERRKQELLTALDRFGDLLREAHTFRNWVRSVRPQVAAGKAKSAFRRVDCRSSKERKARPRVTCSGTYFPHGEQQPTRYELVWYRDRPVLMRATAFNLPFSPVLNCEALGLREQHRRNEDGGRTTLLHCAVDGSAESYAVRQSSVSGVQVATLWWYSAGYLDRDRAARRELQR
ncbi:hypothetical protein ACFL5O_10425 [Myxococcota bacterium]